jgi:hypothetical protein
MACCGDGRGRPGIHACERGGPEKCRASAICAHDQAPGKPPDDRRDSNTWPGCGPTWGASHDIPADRRWEPVTKFLLRDHAQPQLRDLSGVAAKKRRAAGAPVGPRRAGLWRHRPRVAWLAAWRPASAARGTGTRGLGSNAGSNALAYTGAHTPCAGTDADADADGRFAYDDDSPREGALPKGQPGAERSNVPPRAKFKNDQQPVYACVKEPNRQRNASRKARPKKQTELNTEGNSFRNVRKKNTKRRHHRVALVCRSKLDLCY